MLRPSLIILFSILNSTKSANILGLFFSPSLSHQIVFRPIWKELSLRGHQVTVITPNPLNDPSLINLTEIDTRWTYEIVEKVDVPKNMAKDNWAIRTTVWLFLAGEEVVIEQLKAAESVLKNPESKFDLIIAEIHVPLVCVLGCRFKAPIVGMSSLGLYHHTQDAVGNPTHPVVSPDFMINFATQKNLYGRLVSFFQNLWYRVFYYWYYLPKEDKIAHKFWHHCPFLGEVERNVSFILFSTNPILHPVSPKVPIAVEMGQIHIGTKIKKLPKDLQDYLDLSTQGVIYLSLGTNVKSVDLSPRIRGVMIEALSELPYNVLWKWENDFLPNKPKNVMTMKWFPQQDMLRHKNIKVFLTQGGLQSIEEAIANQVPMIGMPIFGDQLFNVMKIVNLGIGRSIDHVHMTKKELKEAILDVSRNKTYTQNIRKLQSILSDHPMSALEKSIWWMEYVLRHKGTTHLRSPAADLSWFEYYFADLLFVFLFASAVSSYFLLLSYRILRMYV